MASQTSGVRRFERLPVQLSVMCGADGRRLADRVVNLSLRGALIQTPAPLPVHTRTHFYFTVPDAKFHDTVVEVPATVVWSRDATMGLQFDAPVGGIEAYVERLDRLERIF